MKNKGILLIAAGVIGGAFVMTSDIIMRKPVNDFTGPISTPALVACGILILTGIIILLKRKPASKKPSR